MGNKILMRVVCYLLGALQSDWCSNPNQHISPLFLFSAQKWAYKSLLEFINIKSLTYKLLIGLTLYKILFKEIISNLEAEYITYDICYTRYYQKCRARSHITEIPFKRLAIHAI